MTTAGKGFPCFWVELAATGFFKVSPGMKNILMAMPPMAKGKKYYGEKKYLHFYIRLN
jgi:hypothetical protein